MDYYFIMQDILIYPGTIYNINQDTIIFIIGYMAKF